MAGGNDSLYAVGAMKPAGVIEQGQELAGPQGQFALLHGAYWRLKRPLSLMAALIAITLCAPALLAISLYLAHQGQPIFIRRSRLGLHGKPFNIYHFRTMKPDSLRRLGAGEMAPDNTFGAMLKRTRLDHLPLLWNVLRGDMHLVGPRPLAQEELMGAGRLARYSLAVRPGLTGLWWVEQQPDLRRRLASDRSYIERASPLLDLKILGRTIAHMHGV